MARLIDADKLKEAIKDYFSPFDGSAYCDDIYNAIDNSPTIKIPTDSKWIVCEEDMAKCDKCGFTLESYILGSFYNFLYFFRSNF